MISRAADTVTYGDEHTSATLISALAVTLTLTIILTALLGVWVAYDKTVAWQRFGLLAGGIIAAGTLGWAGRRGGERASITFCYSCTLLAAVVSVITVTSQQWMWDLTVTLHPNAAAGALAITIPFGVAGLYHSWRRRNRTVVFLALSALVLACGALVLTGSRGAWIGVAAGAFMALTFRNRTLSRRSASAAIVGIAALFVAGFWLALRVSVFETLRSAGADGSMLGRILVWWDMLALVPDYLFTGSGLGVTGLVYSSYMLLLHVPFLFHAHNLFLQIAVEQGIFAVIAFVWLAGTCLYLLLRTTRRSRWFVTAAIASLIALLVHGMLDAELYVSWMAPLVFLPLTGVIYLLPEQSRDSVVASANALRRPVLAVGSVALILVVAALQLPSVQATVQANLGAVAQTQVELSIYRRPAWPVQDAVRRSPTVDLTPAIARYDAALRLDPGNVVANRRLGQIALSTGNYDVARRYLEAAYHVAPEQRATRQMLGEIYALASETERAVSLWRTLELAHGQLDLRLWWHTHLDAEQSVTRLKKAQAATLAVTD